MNTEKYDGKTIVLASGNEGKAREFSQMLNPLGFKLILQKEFGLSTPEESGLSFLENALLKARYVCSQTGLPALADDSGLCVDALDGAPGLYSARFASVDGRDARDEDNNQKLLKLLEPYGKEERRARYWCALALVKTAADCVPITAVASWEGLIAQKPAGSDGFGYDPLFCVIGRNCTAAQLPLQLKNLISHRGRALKQLVYKLRHKLC